MGTPWQPDKQVSALFLRSIIDETYVKCKESGYPMPDATELCLCIPYMRRPIIEDLANGGRFGETNVSQTKIIQILTKLIFFHHFSPDSKLLQKFFKFDEI